MKKHKIELEDIERSMISAIKKKIFNTEDSSILFYDLTYLEERFCNLKSVFPKNTLHAVAVKANPLVKVLEFMQNRNAGAEAASISELFFSVKLGFDKHKIVFDSPAKTVEELRYALKNNIYINADSFSEIDRMQKILKELNTDIKAGIRINPQVGAGSIISTSVADVYSKFGIELNTHRKKLIEYYKAYNWLKGVHVHIGSQGCSLELLVKGVKAIYDFVKEVNQILLSEKIDKRIEIFDIGGGLPVSYHFNRDPVKIEDYCFQLNEQCPDLFNGNFFLITEFGRYLYANAGWVASRVEYLKRGSTVDTAVIHVGADMFLRRCYRPEDWYHEVSVFDSFGNLKRGEKKKKITVAGPLCFAGDVIGQEIMLPEINEGDYIVIHDAGAYTLSMWSRYNSRLIPKVMGYYDNGKVFEILKRKESKEELFSFWS